MKKIITFFLIILCVLSEAVMAENVISPGSSTGDWTAISYMLSEKEFDKTAYLTSLEKYVADKYLTEDKLSRTKATEWHRIAIAVNLAGEDATNFAGVNLVNDGVFYRENLGRQGLNGYIWALTTIETLNAKAPVDAINTKESILNYILSKQNEDGGFALSGNKSSCDITAMAIYALSFSYDREEVKHAVDNAKAYLFSVQNEDGSFSDGSLPNAESTAQVIIALSALGEDVTEEKAFKSLEKFKTEDGFSHVEGGASDPIATYQALCAIAAAKSKSAVYSSVNVNRESKKNEEKVFVSVEKVTEQTDVPTDVETEAETETETEEYTSEAETVAEKTEKIHVQNDDKTTRIKKFDYCWALIFPFIAFCVIIVRRKK